MLGGNLRELHPRNTRRFNIIHQMHQNSISKIEIVLAFDHPNIPTNFSNR